MQNEETKEIRYADLFGGVGGFRLGIQRAWSSRQQGRGSQEDLLSRRNSPTNETTWNNYKPKCVFYSDIDKYSVQTYNKNFKENHEPTDITKISTDDIPEIDMLCGGFPCQAFSIAGKRRGFQDTRGTLFFEIARIIKAKRPKIVFLENVKGLLNHEQGKTFRTIIQTISELGYDVQWMVLNSKFFGVPQNRERVFIIGSLRGTGRPEILPFRSYEQEIDSERAIVRTFTAGGHSGGLHSNSTGIIHNVYGGFGENKMREFIEYSPTIRTPKGGGHLPMVFQPAQLVNKNRAKKPYNPNDREMKIKVRNDETSYTVKSATHEFMVTERTIMDLYNHSENSENSEICPTLKDPCHNDRRVREGMKIRRLTPIECERLQGFPDGWTEGVSDTQRYKQMGNAVTINVIQAIAKKLINDFEMVK